MRENIVGWNELREIVVADLVLIIAFSLTLTGGLQGFANGGAGAVAAFLFVLPIVAVGVTLSFVLHELMHKFVAQRYGAIAGFRASIMGLAITLITGAFGFLVGIPGATMIYTNSFTKRENGIVSLAGPLTNFVVFAVALVLLFALVPAPSSYLFAALKFIIFISILLAFFNMLPIFPLDGSKVFSWNKPVYVVTMAAILFLIWEFSILPLIAVGYLLFIALLLSIFYRHMFR